VEFSVPEFGGGAVRSNHKLVRLVVNSAGDAGGTSNARRLRMADTAHGKGTLRSMPPRTRGAAWEKRNRRRHGGFLHDSMVISLTDHADSHHGNRARSSDPG
jgi:hypothetical protein